MLFSSTVFLFLFLPVALLGYYVIFRKNRKAQNVFLLLTSLFFYAWGEPWFVFVMIGSILGNWFFGLLVDRYRDQKIAARRLLALMFVFNLLILFLFKYLMFTLNNIKSLFAADFNIPTIFLPIGISFFTFQAISYVIDVYRKQGDVQKNPFNVGLYISFFPQLIAGPIVRYETISDQIQNRKETLEDFSQGVCRFIVGLGKKVLIANTMAVLADKAFLLPGDELSLSFSWLGAIAYTFQIYFDFSGYSDMAIGLGKMFGFHFLENFDYPYISKTISEFWRRWHISLGTWFKDYLYIPLGGSRVKTKFRLILNLLIVWSLTGLWHGANWTFILWGLLYFVLLIFEKLTDFDHKVKIGFIKHFYTLLFVVVGWVIFRAADIGQAAHYLKTMFAMNPNRFFDENTIFYLGENKFFLLFAFLFSMPITKWISQRIKLKENTILAVLYQVTYMVLFIISVSYITKGSYNPFIYFNF